MRVETRAALRLMAPRSRPRLPEERGCTAHWNGPPMRLKGRPHSECQARWRGIQKFHMGPQRNWADVAYTFAVCHHEIALEGRGKGVRTAANGTNAGNNAWYACFFMVGEGEEPSEEMLRAAEWYARVHLGVTRWNRHTDHKATACAGTVNKYISNGKISTKGSSTPGSGGVVLRQGDGGPAVRAWQRQLLKWNSKALPRFGADGDFGAETDEWTKRFQREAKIGVDGVVGPQTLQAMERQFQPTPPKAEPVPSGPFSDVPSDHPHAKSIERVKELGLMTGHPDGSFRPQENFTRAQAAAVFTRLYDLLK